MTKEKRVCGTCTACCTVIAIPELSKRSNVTCKFVQDSRCSIYPCRPRCCSGFSCEWLDGRGTNSERPDISGVVIQQNLIGQTGIEGVHMWEVHQCALSWPAAQRAQKEFIARKIPVVLYPKIGGITILIPKGTMVFAGDMDQERRKIRYVFV